MTKLATKNSPVSITSATQKQDAKTQHVLALNSKNQIDVVAFADPAEDFGKMNVPLSTLSLDTLVKANILYGVASKLGFTPGSHVNSDMKLLGELEKKVSRNVAEPDKAVQEIVNAWSEVANHDMVKAHQQAQSASNAHASTSSKNVGLVANIANYPTVVTAYALRYLSALPAHRVPEFSWLLLEVNELLMSTMQNREFNTSTLAQTALLSTNLDEAKRENPQQRQVIELLQRALFDWMYQIEAIIDTEIDFARDEPTCQQSLQRLAEGHAVSDPNFVLTSRYLSHPHHDELTKFFSKPLPTQQAVKEVILARVRLALKPAADTAVKDVRNASTSVNHKPNGVAADDDSHNDINNDDDVQHTTTSVRKRPLDAPQASKKRAHVEKAVKKDNLSDSNDMDGDDDDEDNAITLSSSSKSSSSSSAKSNLNDDDESLSSSDSGSESVNRAKAERSLETLLSGASLSKAELERIASQHPDNDVIISIVNQKRAEILLNALPDAEPQQQPQPKPQLVQSRSPKIQRSAVQVQRGPVLPRFEANRELRCRGLTRQQVRQRLDENPQAFEKEALAEFKKVYWQDAGLVSYINEIQKHNAAKENKGYGCTIQ